MPQPPPPFPPAKDPPWAGVVGHAINQLEERVEARLALFHEELALLRDGIGSLTPGPMLPPPPDTEPAPASRRDKAMGALRFTGKGSTLLLAAVGALGVAVQLASAFKPGLVGPIQTLLELLKGLVGQ